MDVDEPRGHDHALGVDAPLRISASETAHCLDGVALQAHVGLEPGIAGAVDDPPVLDENIISHIDSSIAPCIWLLNGFRSSSDCHWVMRALASLKTSRATPISPVTTQNHQTPKAAAMPPRKGLSEKG